jgi:hypothetical protein
VAGAAVAGLAVAAGAAQPDSINTVTNAAMINLFKLAFSFLSDYGWNDRKHRKNIFRYYLLVKKYDLISQNQMSDHR